MSGKLDPVIQASNLLIQFMKSEDIEPMAAMTAMTQLAAKIAFDSAQQEKLSEEDARNRWMGGAMLAYDAAAGGKAGFETDAEHAVRTMQPGTRRHLILCPGVGKGTKKGIKHRRERNKQARKTRRTNRGKR
jgi:hypothetical protein